MKKILTVFLIVCMTATMFVGCDQRQADDVSYNLSLQADNFNDVRQITVINCLTGDVLFQMTGKMSIEVDGADNQLEVIVEDERGEYKKHFIHLGTHIEYVVEDITSDDVSNYHYTLNFNPKMWLPEIETVD
jgi:hypothetical protein